MLLLRLCSLRNTNKLRNNNNNHFINMSLKIVVLAKQVPDTRNVGKDAMTAEGTVNRAALPLNEPEPGGCLSHHW